MPMWGCGFLVTREAFSGRYTTSRTSTSQHRGIELFPRFQQCEKLLVLRLESIPNVLRQSYVREETVLKWCTSGVKVVDLGPIENYEALVRDALSVGLDPIISCPLSGSVCYAIGLRGLDRRAVCFVSLIAERLSGGPLSALFPPTPPSSPPPTAAPFFTLFFVPCNVAARRPPFYF